MTAPLSEQQLAEIAARVAAATRGPWETDTDTYTEHDGSTSIGIANASDLWIVPLQNLDPADAAFIAAAREDVPALLADATLLRSELVERTTFLTRVAADLERATARVAELEAERHTTNEALDDAVKAIREKDARLRARIAQDVNRADRPEFPTGERPDLIVRSTRAIDIHIIEMGPYAPYWVPEGGER